MNKTKKLAMAAVAVVMAGSMALSVTACGPNKPKDDGADGSVNVAASKNVVAANPDYKFGDLSGGLGNVPESAAKVIEYLTGKSMSNFQDMMSEAWESSYNYYKNGVGSGTGAQAKLTIGTSADGQTLRMNVCDGTNAQRRVAYESGQISNVITGLDGKKYTSSSDLASGDVSMVKPAWREMGAQLGIGFSNVAQGKASDKQITEDLTNINGDSYDIVTASTDAIVQQAMSQGGENTFLDLNQYLGEMPNYKAFLDANPIVKLSLVSNTSTGAMYYAPYFDGNDDIEKYELINRNWVKALLGDTAATSTLTYKAHAESKANTASSAQSGGYTDALSPVTTETAIVSFMGKNDWSIDVTDASNVTATKKVYIQYSKALEAVKDSSSALGSAYNTAVGAAYTGDSGNIVDIMNAAINAKQGEVAGKDLLNMLRAYIDVTYTDENSNKFYANRADVFIGQDAAWDVDLLAALSRCLVTNVDILPAANADGDKVEASKIYAISGRANTTQRNSDLYGLAGELYGVRGLTPRYQFAYIDNAGVLQDARMQEAAWNAMQNMHAFVSEGLIHLTDEVNTSPNPTVYAKDKGQTMMEYDYVQTQTQEGYNLNKQYYDVSAIITPVSKWDVDGNKENGNEVTMRFTESWRSVKNTGFCVPYSSVVNNPAKLKAVLTFIDYLFSNDGQITATFGPQASGANAYDGFWYATKVTNKTKEEVGVQVAGSTQWTVKPEYAKDYFIFKNEVYTGTAYKGTQIPTLTKATLDLFEGKAVTLPSGSVLKRNDTASYNINWKLAYTDFARGVIGAALPIGNKNQGFEYQCTAACGLEGAAVVGNALANGTIKHTTVTIDENNLWYTLVPSALPYSTADANTIKNDYSDLQSGLFGNGSKILRNAWLDVMYYGYGYNK